MSISVYPFSPCKLSDSTYFIVHSIVVVIIIVITVSVSDVRQAVRGGVFLESVVEHGDGHSLHAEMGLVWQQVEAVANPL